MSEAQNAHRLFKADPLQIASAAIAALMTMAILNQLSVWFAPLMFVVCVGGMVWVFLARIRAERVRKLGEQSVDYQKLAEMDVSTLAPWMKENIRGHDLIVDSVFSSLTRSLQLARPGRTLGNFILVGPTGTGKTFFSQLLGSGLYPKSEIVLLDLNQFKHADDVFTLIGPPPGRPGYEVGGRLTRPVLENPYRVIILNELEKAHHDLHDCLYDILDTGSCREKSSGRLVDFSASVIVASCNGGVDQLRNLLGEVGSMSSSGWLGRSRDALADAAKFDRAFLARWDGVYLMDKLPPIHVAEVACLELCRYWRQYGIEIDYTAPEIIIEAVKRNQDFSEYGVRQLARFVREKTESAILDAKRNGSKRIHLYVNGHSGDLQVEAAR